MAMHPEIKAQWTAALRSGEYQQGNGSLSKNGKYCCLGVLCDLAVKAGIIKPAEKWDEAEADEYGSTAETYYLPEAVMDWSGVDYNPNVDQDKLPEGIKWQHDPASKDDCAGASLANLNDGGTTFAVIADIIDQQF